MPDIRILCVGRRAQDPLISGIDDYCDRISRFTKISLTRVREGSVDEEKERLLAAATKNDHWIVLDERGKQLSTMDLTTQLHRWQNQSVRQVTFVIGGASGTHEQVKTRANELWSLSKMTLPHRLAQLVLVEQIYRAYSILYKSPYHKE